MSTKIEIERKFLLKNVPKIKYDSILEIKQFYLKGEKSRLRVVEQNGDGKLIYWKNIKNRLSDLSSEETDEIIDYAQFRELHKDSNGFIYKIRYLIKEEDVIWEIDDFINVKLVIAEVEIPSEKYELKIPEFISNNLIMEVSKIKEFSNRKLAVKFKL